MPTQIGALHGRLDGDGARDPGRRFVQRELDGDGDVFAGLRRGPGGAPAAAGRLTQDVAEHAAAAAEEQVEQVAERRVLEVGVRAAAQAVEAVVIVCRP